MNANSYPSFYAGPGASFEHLGQLLDSTIINDSIVISAKKGSGQIKKTDAVTGLQVYCWDIKLHDELKISKPALPSGREMLSLFYIFSPAHVQVSQHNAGSTTDLPPLKNMILATGDCGLDFTIKGWQPVQLMHIDINRNWLANEYSSGPPSSCHGYNHMLTTAESFLITEATGFDTFHIFSGLLSHINKQQAAPFYMKTKILSLLCDVLVNADRQREHVQEASSAVREKMIAVEKLLDEYLETNLPSIGTIAKQMAVSESTLKRNFKQLYGTSIYEYYLQKKMKMARQLFAERPVPVKEVAYRLGYEKVSNFIQMFKKYYHFSPGRLKKTAGFMDNEKMP